MQPDSIPAAVAVATCGTALTAEHVALLAAAGGAAAPLVVAFDPDRAGRAAAERAHRVLEGQPGRVRALELPADPADLLRDHGAVATRTAVTAAGRPLLDAVVDHCLRRRAEDLRAGWIETRVAALRSVAPLVASDPRPDELGRRIASLAARLDLSPATVVTAVLEAHEAAYGPGDADAAAAGRTSAVGAEPGTSREERGDLR